MEDRILLFVPMYNCEKQIVRVLEQIDENISKIITEVILVNNRSTDNGEQAVIDYLKNKKMNIPVTLLRNDENYGLGGSHKVAFNYAINNNFDYVIVLHGDDQGNIYDFYDLLQSKEYQKYDCCLGARFMKGSKLKGYSKIRTWGNYGFNIIFSIFVGYNVKDMGSGLNLFKVSTLKSKYYIKYPDTLYFNNCLMLAYKYYKHKILFYPITWREDDQVSNNKLIKFTLSLLKMLFKYKFDKEYLNKDLRTRIIDDYTAQTIYTNKGEEK